LQGADRDRPALGVLKGIGYSVGNIGVEAGTRHLLIDYLVDGQILPPIKDQSYMAEWGNSRTVKRYFKAYRVLDRFAQEYWSSETHTRAVSNWLNDLTYMERKWGFLSGRPNGLEPS